MRRAIIVGIVIETLYYTAFTAVAISSLVKCNALAQMKDQFCINYGKPVVVMNATVNVVTDFYILLLPIPCVLSLQMSSKRKVGILLVFAGGVA